MVVKKCTTCKNIVIVPSITLLCPLPLCYGILEQIYPIVWSPDIPLSTSLSVIPPFRGSSMGLWRHFPSLSATNVIQSLMFSRLKAILDIKEEYSVELYTGHNRGRRLVMERTLPTERLGCDLTMQPYEWCFSKTKNYFEGSTRLIMNPGTNQSLFNVMMAARLEFSQPSFFHSRISGNMDLAVNSTLDPTLYLKDHPHLAKLAPKFRGLIRVQGITYVADLDYPLSLGLDNWTLRHPISSVRVKVTPKIGLSVRANKVQCGPVTLRDPYIESSINIFAFDSSDTKFGGNISGRGGHGDLELALPKPKPRDLRVVRMVKNVLPKKVRLLKANTYDYNFNFSFDRSGGLSLQNQSPSPSPSPHRLKHLAEMQPGGMYDTSNFS